jgi:hypothetical protein
VIGDKVWNDVNKNGIQDNGEAGVNGVTVRLLAATTLATVATTTTNSSGIYNFTAVAPGDYRVEFVAPANQAFTTRDLGGDDRLDSDATSTPASTPPSSTTLVIFPPLPVPTAPPITACAWALPLIRRSPPPPILRPQGMTPPPRMMKMLSRCLQASRLVPA